MSLVSECMLIRIIGIDDELLKETKKTLSAFDSSDRVCFQFDTTFNLTGYYVSVLLYIHPILVIDNTDKAQPIPFAYYFHEKNMSYLIMIFGDKSNMFYQKFPKKHLK